MLRQLKIWLLLEGIFVWATLETLDKYVMVTNQTGSYDLGSVLCFCLNVLTYTVSLAVSWWRVQTLFKIVLTFHALCIWWKILHLMVHIWLCPWNEDHFTRLCFYIIEYLSKAADRDGSLELMCLKWSEKWTKQKHFSPIIICWRWSFATNPESLL